MAEESFQNNFFDTEHLKTDLKGRSVRGGAVTMAGQGVKFFLRTGSTVVLARLLTPQDFGLLAMVAAVTGFLVLFKDMGLSMATVQRAEVNHNQISTLFWINVSLSLGVMLVIVALAPVIAWFYGEPRLTLITAVLACGGVLGGLTIQHQALLRRQMRFTALAVIEIISMSVGILTAIIAAFYGAGCWALVLMQLATAITGAIAVWVVCGWRPGLPVRRSGIREMLAFGGNLTGFNFLNYFARNADNLLIGKFWGSGPLGLYSKAYGLLMLPIRQITGPLSAVAIPALSSLQNDPERYRRYYCKAMNQIAFLTTPLIVTLAVLSDEIILILLGEQWLGASNIFKVLAIAAVGQPIASATGWIYVSLGQTKRMRQWGMISVPLFVLSFIVGLPWGPIGVAVSYAICVHIIRYPGFLFVFKYAPVKIRNLISAVWRPMTISLIMFLTMSLTRLYIRSLCPFWVIFCACLVGLLTLSSIIVFWPDARTEFFEIMRSIRLLNNSQKVQKELPYL